MDVYRINKEPYHTQPLSVAGSYRYGGRWDPKGRGILYTSRSPELALLETLVHLPPVGLSALPQLWLTTLRLPDSPRTVFWLDPALLPVWWRTGVLSETQLILQDWLLDPFSLAVAVPSVILDISFNILLHPDHPDYGQITIVNQRPVPLDSRLIR
jgi:RES domain-containing protein